VQENKERWKMLCEKAAVEQDPVKLRELVKEISDLLEAKQKRLKGTAPTQSA
jgi:hypothetical protein